MYKFTCHIGSFNYYDIKDAIQMNKQLSINQRYTVVTTNNKFPISIYHTSIKLKLDSS